jgi:hypothetical protein
MDVVRICLNDNNYTQPSGGYKAHSESMVGANSHLSGVGMEEWLNSPINLLSGDVWSNDVLIEPFGDGDYDNKALYRVGFLEAFRFVNYKQAVQGKPGDVDRCAPRDVLLVRNTDPNKWERVGCIRNLRGLSLDESHKVYDYFAVNGVIDLMNRQMQTAHLVSQRQGIAYGTHPMLPLHFYSSTTVPQDTFTCIFKVEDLHWCLPPVPITMHPGHHRYTRRY